MPFLMDGLRQYLMEIHLWFFHISLAGL